MVYDLTANALTFPFRILSAIWNAPFWLIVLIVVVCFVLWMIMGDSSEPYSNISDRAGSADSQYDDKPPKIVINVDEPEHAFVFYDSHGDRCGRGDCFYDSRGNRCSWGNGFYDGKGYYRNWGENYYDARGFFRSWGECFYDAKGNLVYTEW